LRSLQDEESGKGLCYKSMRADYWNRIMIFLKKADPALKRLLDIVFSLLLIGLFSPVMILIIILIKLTSRGPVLFSQKRYGLKGSEIKVFKFRTMYEIQDGDLVEQAKPGDPRITPIGRFLRRMSLDELPQLFNVLIGNMSFVGPRPHSIAINNRFRETIQDYMRRYDVKPGITGWAQIHGYRGYTPTQELMEKRVSYDLWYIQHRSIGLDGVIVFRTIFRIFNDKTAG
jgi:putative colanic acid biosysnthesis UDP-glucose lipid carrier transferase